MIMEGPFFEPNENLGHTPRQEAAYDFLKYKLDAFTDASVSNWIAYDSVINDKYIELDKLPAYIDKITGKERSLGKIPSSDQAFTEYVAIRKENPKQQGAAIMAFEQHIFDNYDIRIPKKGDWLVPKDLSLSKDNHKTLDETFDKIIQFEKEIRPRKRLLGLIRENGPDVSEYDHIAATVNRNYTPTPPEKMPEIVDNQLKSMGIRQQVQVNDFRNRERTKVVATTGYNLSDMRSVMNKLQKQSAEHNQASHGVNKGPSQDTSRSI